MKAILINPYLGEVSEVDLPDPNGEGGYEGFNSAIYALLSSGAPCPVCSFDVAYFQCDNNPVFCANDSVLVDDEGLLGDLTKQSFFTIPGVLHAPLAGNGVVLGVDDEGGSIPPAVPIEQLRAAIRFLSLDDVRRLVR